MLLKTFLTMCSEQNQSKFNIWCDGSLLFIFSGTVCAVLDGNELGFCT